jgi:hypothetical protein
LTERDKQLNDNSTGNNSFAFIFAGSNINGFSNAGKTARVAAYNFQPADLKK